MKSKSKKILSLFLAAVMMLAVIPLGVIMATAATNGDFEYSVISYKEKTCKIDKYTWAKANLTVPSKLGEYTVTSIGDHAFEGCDSLESITIPNSVKTIGARAFSNCRSLTSITIPDSVTSIDINAFAGTAYYKNESNWENGVLYIGKHLIKAKDTVSGAYTIKDGTISVGYTAFYGCGSLVSVTIPDSVVSIDALAFERTAYYDDESNWKNGVLYIGNYLIAAKKDTVFDEYIIKDGTICIANNAFSGCHWLKSITIPDGVKSMGEYTFCDCDSLERIVIPNSVTAIRDYAFKDCTSLTSITIPNGVTSIGDYAFESCSTLTSVTIPDSVTILGDYAFENCSSLTSVTISKGVTSIGDYVFDGCFSLTSATIPDSVTIIGYHAFYNYGLLTIYGYAGSYAETYADERSIPFSAIAKEEKSDIADGDEKTSETDKHEEKEVENDSNNTVIYVVTSVVGVIALLTVAGFVIYKRNRKIMRIKK